jgi:hypothetical protein
MDTRRITTALGWLPLWVVVTVWLLSRKRAVWDRHQLLAADITLVSLRRELPDGRNGLERWLRARADAWLAKRLAMVEQFLDLGVISFGALPGGSDDNPLEPGPPEPPGTGPAADHLPPDPQP